MNSEQKELPDGWKWAKLEDVCDIILGQSPPSSTYRKTPEGIPFYQGKADFGEVSPSPTTWCVEPKKIAEPGDILISVRAPVGPTNIANTRCCIGRGLAALRCNSDVNRNFLLATLRLFESNISQMGSGSTFKAITGKQLRALPVPVPSLQEQKRIAAVLDERMASVEKARRAAEEMMDAVDALKNAILRELLPYLGQELAAGWKWVKLGDVCQFKYGSGLTQRSRIPGPIPVYGSNGIVGTHSESLIEAPALIIGRKGSAGQVHMARQPCWPIDTTYYISTNDTEEDMEWLFYALKSMNLANQEKSSAIPGLNRNDAYAMKIALPPLSEQKRIAKLLNQHMAVQERAKAAALQQLDAIESLRPALLRQAFSGAI